MDIRTEFIAEGCECGSGLGSEGEWSLPAGERRGQGYLGVFSLSSS